MITDTRCHDHGHCQSNAMVTAIVKCHSCAMVTASAIPLPWSQPRHPIAMVTAIAIPLSWSSQLPFHCHGHVNCQECLDTPAANHYSNAAIITRESTVPLRQCSSLVLYGGVCEGIKINAHCVENSTRLQGRLLREYTSFPSLRVPNDCNQTCGWIGCRGWPPTAVRAVISKIHSCLTIAGRHRRKKLAQEGGFQFSNCVVGEIMHSAIHMRDAHATETRMLYHRSCRQDEQTIDYSFIIPRPSRENH